MRDIDMMISILQTAYPQVTVEQLRVAHPGADDDGIWFFRDQLSAAEVQIESSAGALPFLIESESSSAQNVSELAEALLIVAELLGLEENAT